MHNRDTIQRFWFAVEKGLDVDGINLDDATPPEDDSVLRGMGVTDPATYRQRLEEAKAEEYSFGREQGFVWGYAVGRGNPSASKPAPFAGASSSWENGLDRGYDDGRDQGRDDRAQEEREARNEKPGPG